MDTAALLLSLKLAAATVADPAAGGRRRSAACSRRATSPRKPFVEALFALPLVLPPTVLGYYLLVAMGADIAARPLVRVR